MNIAKKNIALLGLLIAQAALIALLYRPGQNAAPAAASIFPALTPDSVTGMTITDDKGKTISLAKKEGTWQVSLGDFPADPSKIEGLIKKLADAKTSRLVSQTAASHARLKVADTAFNRKVELGTSQGGTKTIFYLGTAPSSKSIHLRLAEAKEVYQINDLAAWEVQPEKESWWQTRYVSQPIDALTGVTIVNAQGTIELIKEGDKGWRLKDKPEETLDSKRVEMLINSISEITIASYQAKDYAPKAKPLTTVTYQSKDGDRTLQIWAKDKPEAQDMLVKASASAFFALAKEYGLKDAMDITVKALIAQPVAKENTGATEGGASGTESLPATFPAPITSQPDK